MTLLLQNVSVDGILTLNFFFFLTPPSSALRARSPYQQRGCFENVLLQDERGKHV